MARRNPCFPIRCPSSPFTSLSRPNVARYCFPRLVGEREKNERNLSSVFRFFLKARRAQRCVEDLPEISRATNVRRRRGTCRVESNPPSVFIFLNKGERGFFLQRASFVLFGSIWRIFGSTGNAGRKLMYN